MSDYCDRCETWVSSGDTCRCDPEMEHGDQADAE